MSILRVACLAFAIALAGACSKKSTAAADAKITEKPDHESVAAEQSVERRTEGDEADEAEAAPENEEIGEDCVAFLRATRATSAAPGTADCPQCPTSDTRPEVLHFEHFEVNRISSSEGACQVAVTIHARFNKSAGGRIVGGLIGWISPDKREQYERGETPAGSQVYKVSVIYQRRKGAWKAVEFNKTAG